MVNIICQNDNTVRFTQFDPTSTYELSDLYFYIPSDKAVLSLYCVFKNSSNEIDSLKLISTSSDNKFYSCYKFSNDQQISLISGETELFLFGIYEDKTTFTTNTFNMILNVENFNTTNQLYVINELDKSVVNYYNKIIELTKQNINILSDMYELKGGGLNDK